MSKIDEVRTALFGVLFNLRQTEKRRDELEKQADGLTNQLAALELEQQAEAKREAAARATADAERKLEQEALTRQSTHADSAPTMPKVNGAGEGAGTS